LLLKVLGPLAAKNQDLTKKVTGALTGTGRGTKMDKKRLAREARVSLSSSQSYLPK